jgi:hypothetical protein
MLMPDKGRIDVSGETGVACKAGGQREPKQEVPSEEEAFHFRQSSLDRGSVFIDVRWRIPSEDAIPAVYPP